MPDLIGRTEVDAKAMLQNFLLDLGTVSRQSCNEEGIHAGDVSSTDPAAGSPVKLHSAVSLVISTGPCKVTIPQGIIGIQQNAAVDTLNKLCGQSPCLVVTAENKTDPSREAGAVISSEPAPGTEVNCDGAVKLIVSVGRCYVNLPDVTNQSRAAAEGEIYNEGDKIAGSSCANPHCIKLDLVEKFDDTVAKGSVIRTEPVGGSPASCDATVTLFISSGPCKVKVPLLKGQELSAAIQALQDNQLKYQETEEDYSETVDKGKVIGSKPAFDSEEPCGTAVNLVISKGKCVKVIPPVKDKTKEQAEAALQALNIPYEVKTKPDIVPKGYAIETNPIAESLRACDDTTTVIIWVSDGKAPSIEFSITPTEIVHLIDKQIILKWKVDNYTEFEIREGNRVLGNNSNLLKEGQLVQDAPTSTTTYTLFARGTGGTNQVIKELKVTPPFPPNSVVIWPYTFNATLFDIGKSVYEYDCGIIGYKFDEGDIQESGTHYLLYAYMEGGSNGSWWIHADFKTESQNLTKTITTICFDKKLANPQAYEFPQPQPITVLPGIEQAILNKPSDRFICGIVGFNSGRGEIKAKGSGSLLWITTNWRDATSPWFVSAGMRTATPLTDFSVWTLCVINEPELFEFQTIQSTGTEIANVTSDKICAVIGVEAQEGGEFQVTKKMFLFWAYIMPLTGQQRLNVNIAAENPWDVKWKINALCMDRGIVMISP